LATAFETGTPSKLHPFRATDNKRLVMKGMLLWALGIPIPVIIGLYLFHVL
jgi:hypothetical protein